jgi:UDP-N-acetylmuramate--alanine ligase
LAVAHRLGVGFGAARSALAEFHGVGRRFEIIGELNRVTVIDDYAHHPSEIRATLAAAKRRYPEATIWAVFQPHTYSRTKAFLDKLAESFGEADRVIVTDIFAAREAPDSEISGELLAERIQSTDAQFIASLDGVVDALLREVQPGSVVLTLSAGDADRVSRELIAGLESTSKGELHG